MTSESMMVEGISPIRCSISVTCPLFRRLGVTGHCQISRSRRSYEKIRDCELSRINHKMYNIIYTYLFINFAKRLGSLTEQAPLRVPEKKKKISNTTKQNDITLETTKKKKKCKCKNRIGKDIDKNINNTYDQASSSMAD